MSTSHPANASPLSAPGSAQAPPSIADPAGTLAQPPLSLGVRALSPVHVLSLQSVVGNQAVVRMLAARRPLISRASAVLARLPGQPTVAGQARGFAATGQYGAALQLLAQQLPLGTLPTNCVVNSTPDFASVVPAGTPVRGSPYAVTIGTDWDPTPGIAIYVKESWIVEWLVNHNFVGNLLNVLTHEAVHARQRADHSRKADVEQSEPEIEFEAYCQEIEEAQRLVASPAADSDTLPTEQQIRSARENVDKQFSHIRTKYGLQHPSGVPRLLETRYLNVTKDFDQLVGELSSRVPTSSLEQAVSAGFTKFNKEVGALPRTDLANLPNIMKPLTALATTVRNDFSALNSDAQTRLAREKTQFDIDEDQLSDYEKRGGKPVPAKPRVPVPVVPASAGTIFKLAPPPGSSSRLRPPRPNPGSSQGPDAGGP